MKGMPMRAFRTTDVWWLVRGLEELLVEPSQPGDPEVAELALAAMGLELAEPWHVVLSGSSPRSSMWAAEVREAAR